MITPAQQSDQRDDTPPAVGAWGRLGRLLGYRHQTVLWSVAVALAVGLAYYATAPRYYRSEAKLLVLDPGGQEKASPERPTEADSLMTTQGELVRSAVVVRRAIETLPPEHRIDFLDRPPHARVEEVANRLRVSTSHKTKLLHMCYESLAPEAAEAVVRAVIEAYRDFASETHRGNAADLLGVLTDERGKLEQELARKQRELLRLREDTGHLAIADRQGVVDPIVGRAIHFNDALIAAQERRVELQSSITTVRAAMDRGEDLSPHTGLVTQAVGEATVLAALGASTNDLGLLAAQQTKLLELQERLDEVSPFYGPSHPDVASLRRQIAATEDFLASHRSDATGRPRGMPQEELGPLLLSMLNQALTQAEERERQLAASFESARREASRHSNSAVRLGALAREVQRLESLHDSLLEKVAAVETHRPRAPLRISIAQAPVSAGAPCSPRLWLVLSLSLSAGVCLGLLAACLQDRLDDRCGSPEEMAHRLGCRLLSVVPDLEQHSEEGLNRIPIPTDQRESDSQAFRALRAAIDLSAAVTERLVITSSEPGTGKTTVSMNLAASYAQTRRRTLLIDCDLRTPGLTALLGLKGQTGLSDILTEEGDLSRVAERSVAPTQIDTLDVIPAGPRRPDPAGSLRRGNFAELLAWADSRYDQVLIDCPSALETPDPHLVARLADGVVLVANPEKNDRHLLNRAWDRFALAGRRPLGIVANQIPAQVGETRHQVVKHEDDQIGPHLAA